MRILKFPILSLAMLMATSCSSPAPRPPDAPTAAPSEPEPDDQFAVSEAMPPRVYKSGTGINLEMLFLARRDGEPDKALVRFTGAKFPTAGKVMLATDVGDFEGQIWKIRYDGRETTLVTVFFVGTGGSRGELHVKLFMPRTKSSVALALDEEASKAFDIEAFVATHKRHRADGSLAAFEALDRPYHVAEMKRWVDHSAKGIVELCGQSIPYEVDWASIADKDVQGRTPCRHLLDATAKACRRDAFAREITLDRIKKLHCAHESKFSLRLRDDGTLHMGTPVDYSLNYKKVYAKIGNLLGFGEVAVADDRGRILVFDPDDVTGEHPSYLGDDKVLYQLRHIENDLGSWDPHGSSPEVRYARHESGWRVQCRKKNIHFKAVDAARREKILREAERKGPRWKRREYALARDNRGIYYYVDSYDEQFGGKNYRVFKGPRGQLQETTLMDIVDDSDGMIFSTKHGKLRLVIGADRHQEALWIEGKARHKLVVLPITENRELIYVGLGVYDADIMGSVCE